MEASLQTFKSAQWNQKSCLVLDLSAVNKKTKHVMLIYEKNLDSYSSTLFALELTIDSVKEAIKTYKINNEKGSRIRIEGDQLNYTNYHIQHKKITDMIKQKKKKKSKKCYFV